MQVATAEWELEALLVTNQAVWPNLFAHHGSITDKERIVLRLPAKRLARRFHCVTERNTCAGSVKVLHTMT
jgi:hypothetical protein